MYQYLQFGRTFQKLPSEIDREDLEDFFDLLIVASLTDDEETGEQRAKHEWTDDGGPLGKFKTFTRSDMMQFGFKVVN